MSTLLHPAVDRSQKRFSFSIIKNVGPSVGMGRLAQEALLIILGTLRSLLKCLVRPGQGVEAKKQDAQAGNNNSGTDLVRPNIWPN